MTTRKWKLEATDQDGNDISDEVSAEFEAIIQATRLEHIAPGRISLLFLLSLFGAFKAGRINPFQLAREIEALEKGEATGLKPPIQNRHPPLKGLWHKHYMPTRHGFAGDEHSTWFETVWNSIPATERAGS